MTPLRTTPMRTTPLRTLASTLVAYTLVALAGLAFPAPAHAHRSLSAPHSPPPAVSQPPRQPPLGFDTWGRGPPPPPERPYVAPMPQVAPPMERVPQVAPLSPRVGN